MKILLSSLLFLFLSSSICFAGPRGVTPAEAKALMTKDKQIFLLDVRTREEYQQAHLRGSVLIPLAELQQKVTSLPKNRPIVVYCAVGARSQQAAEYLSSKGFRDVYNMKDGIVGWYRNGFPIEKR